ncbi:MAG: low-specificity L-threonine aldolase [Gammaproteobacteria bacterium]|nr:MAG: low-specificity L-threonine aldolase [Gammaproteobacteria bacterium]
MQQTALVSNNGLKPVDYRSDTVSMPSEAMKLYAASCPLGDDVFEEDPTVKALEEKVADLLGKPAALFFPTGTQSNLAAVLSHCQRGEEVLIGDNYHIYRDEARGVSVLGGVTMETMTTDKTGRLLLEDIKAAIKPDDPHCAITRLVCLENTVSGCVQNQQELDAIADYAHKNNLSVHLDGARLFNAAAAQESAISDMAKKADSVSLCLSKGLGTPAGSVLVGSRDLIKRAKRNRKMLGGGMRQVGFLAACGIYALDNNVNRLVDDHRIAKQLANELSTIEQLEVDLDLVQTNMLFIRPRANNHQQLQEFLGQHNVLIGGQVPFIRMVTHMDILEEDAERTVDLFKQFYQVK